MRAGTQIADWTATDILQGNFAFHFQFGMRSKDISWASPYTYIKVIRGLKTYLKRQASKEPRSFEREQLFVIGSTGLDPFSITKL